ncbi:MAG: hypothetical protein PHN98_01795 [Smithellaceae bacterium]|nr:hypothetical protein [Smithellaceae bacterium]
MSEMSVKTQVGDSRFCQRKSPDFTIYCAIRETWGANCYEEVMVPVDEIPDLVTKLLAAYQTASKDTLNIPCNVVIPLLGANIRFAEWAQSEIRKSARWGDKADAVLTVETADPGILKITSREMCTHFIVALRSLSVRRDLLVNSYDLRRLAEKVEVAARDAGVF